MAKMIDPKKGPFAVKWMVCGGFEVMVGFGSHTRFTGQEEKAWSEVGEARLSVILVRTVSEAGRGAQGVHASPERNDQRSAGFVLDLDSG